MIKALRYNPIDDVIVMLDNVTAGSQVQARGEETEYIAQEAVPAGHKLATKHIRKGNKVIKSGQAIGIATEDIAPGQYVHDHNLKGLIESWHERRNYQYSPSTVQEISDSFRLDPAPALIGWRRKNGMIGFRNHLLVTSTVVCANQIVQDAGAKYPHIAAMTIPTGCLMLSSENDRMKTVLLSLARNPNVGAVIFVGLGCETVGAEWFHDQITDEKPVAFIRIQDEGSTPEAYVKLCGLIEAMTEQISHEKKVLATIADVRLGTKCGGSDWTTTVVSNPAIGFVSDLVVKNGGISLLGETMGWFGGEEMLLKQARTKEIANDILRIMENTYQRALVVGKHVDEGNPTPGNKLGGITTLNEKALGNVKKGGTAPIEAALQYGIAPDKPGLFITDNPGLDPISLLGLTCSSANVILFSTGRGTPTGTLIAPVVKLSGSPEAHRVFSRHLDVDLFQVVTGTMTIEEAGWNLFSKMIDVCNGKLTAAEEIRHREYAFPLIIGPL